MRKCNICDNLGWITTVVNDAKDLYRTKCDCVKKEELDYFLKNNLFNYESLKKDGYFMQYNLFYEV